MFRPCCFEVTYRLSQDKVTQQGAAHSKKRKVITLTKHNTKIEFRLQTKQTLNFVSKPNKLEYRLHNST